MHSIEAKNFIDFLSVSLNTENSRIIFAENQDFLSFLENTKKPKGGNPKLDDQVRTKQLKTFTHF